MSWKLRVRRCDNRLIVTVNDVEAFNEHHDLDPLLSFDKDISSLFTKESNKIEISGYNSPISGGANPWHFEADLEHNGDPKDRLNIYIKSHDAGSSAQPGEPVLHEVHNRPR